ncbi:hypothetical protein ACFL0H_05905 [Thermodesulfobacteriota bacterium]
MDEEEYQKKFVNLKILKSVQEYLKSEGDSSTSVYPIKVPDDLLLQVLKLQGAKSADDLILHIFKLGLTFWSEKLFNDVFGSPGALSSFIEIVKKRNKGTQQ